MGVLFRVCLHGGVVGHGQVELEVLEEGVELLGVPLFAQERPPRAPGGSPRRRRRSSSGGSSERGGACARLSPDDLVPFGGVVKARGSREACGLCVLRASSESGITR